MKTVVRATEMRVMMCEMSCKLQLSMLVKCVDSEGFGSQSELFAGKSNWQWKELSTSLLGTRMAGSRTWLIDYVVSG